MSARLASWRELLWVLFNREALNRFCQFGYWTSFPTKAYRGCVDIR